MDASSSPPLLLLQDTSSSTSTTTTTTTTTTAAVNSNVDQLGNRPSPSDTTTTTPSPSSLSSPVEWFYIQLEEAVRDAYQRQDDSTTTTITTTTTTTNQDDSTKRILDLWEAFQSQHDSSVWNQTSVYNHVLQALVAVAPQHGGGGGGSSSSSSSGLVAARQILDDMRMGPSLVGSAVDHSHSLPPPNRQSFHILLAAYARQSPPAPPLAAAAGGGRRKGARRSPPSGGEQAAALLECMEERAAAAIVSQPPPAQQAQQQAQQPPQPYPNDDDDGLVEPDLFSFASVALALAKAGNVAHAERVLHRMWTKFTTNPPPPDREEWKHLLLSWASSVRHASQARPVAQMMHRLLDRMVEYDNHNDVDPTNTLLSTSTLNQILQCYADHQTRTGAQLAQDLLDWMRRRTSNSRCPPINGDSYRTVILAWCHVANAEQAEALLWDWCDYHQPRRRGQHQDSDPPPVDRSSLDPTVFHAVLQAWAAQSTKPSAKATERVLAIWDRMQQQHYYDDDDEADDEEGSIQPTVEMYNTVLWVLARSESSLVDSAPYMERLFGQMMTKANVQPNEMTFHALLTGLGRSPDSTALERVEAFFRKRQLQTCHNDNNDNNNDDDKNNNNNNPWQWKAPLYNMFMTAWMRHKRPEKVEDLFQEMMMMQNSSNNKNKNNNKNLALVPNARIHMTRLQAWSRTGKPDMAMHALKEWIQASSQWAVVNEDNDNDNKNNHKGNDKALDTARPSTPAFNAILIAWARSARSDAAEKADLALQQMIQVAAAQSAAKAAQSAATHSKRGFSFSCVPDLASYATVIAAHAHQAESNPQAGARAWYWFQQLLLPKQKQSTLLPTTTTTTTTTTPPLSTTTVNPAAVATTAAPAPFLKPDFAMYVDVITALLRSLRPQQQQQQQPSTTTTHHKQPQRVLELLHELQTKNAHFFADKNTTTPGHHYHRDNNTSSNNHSSSRKYKLLHKLRREIQGSCVAATAAATSLSSSSSVTKRELLLAWNALEAIAVKNNEPPLPPPPPILRSNTNNNNSNNNNNNSYDRSYNSYSNYNGQPSHNHNINDKNNNNNINISKNINYNYDSNNSTNKNSNYNNYNNNSGKPSHTHSINFNNNNNSNSNILNNDRTNLPLQQQQQQQVKKRRTTMRRNASRRQPQRP